MKHPLPVLLCGIFVVIGLTVAAFEMWSDSPDSAPATVDLADGAKIYAAQCAACHGVNLEGQPNWREKNPDGTLPAPPHDDSGHTWHHPDSMLFAYTKDGGQAYLDQNGITAITSAMPAFKGILSDDQIRDVLAYIRSRWSARSQKAQAELTARD